MMKKILMMMMIGIFMISIASAFEFDNIKTYDEKTKIVIIENAFGLGDTVAEIKLISDLDNKVGLGYQKVAEFDLIYYLDDNGGMDLMEFYNLNDKMKEIDVEIEYKIKGTEEFSVDDYERKITGKTINGTDIYENIKVGSHIAERVIWNDFNEKDMIKGENYIIGIFTNTKEGDYIEWIPTYYGVKINEWAYWTAGLDTDLVAYYKLDGDAMEEVNGYDGVNQSAIYNTTALIGEALTGGYIEIADQNDFDFSDEFSISIWVRTPDTPVSDVIIAKQEGDVTGANLWFIDYGVAANLVRFYQYDASGVIVSSTADNLSDGTYHHIVITRDGSSDWILYVDNVSRDTGNHAQDYTSTDQIEINAKSDGENPGYNYIDEIGIWKGRALSVDEISLLFEAPPYGDYAPVDNPPTVILNLPANNTNSTSPTITFNCNAYDNSGIINNSLYINGILNATNSSGINNTNYTWTRTLADGNYNWTCEAFDDLNQSTTAGEFFFAINTTPFIEFVAPTYANATNLTTNYIPANISLTETYFANLTIYLYNSSGLFQSVTFTNSTRFYNFTSCLCDNYYLNATIWTTTGQSNSTETREYIIDRTAPTTNLIYPTATNYSTLQTELNYSISDTHLDACWYSTNATINITANCTGNMTGVLSVQGSNTWTIYANDTFGNENESSVTFIVDS